MDTPGTFIVVEGTDGSGKSTQFELLKERLTREGYEVATFKFPRYDDPSSHFVREYLNGKYGSADEVGPYTGSLFYALDRYAATPGLREALQQGKVVLADRFVGSNMAHQGTKFRHAEERRGYFIWLDNLEFEMLRIPRPSLSVVLRVPAETAQTLIDQHGARTYTDKKRDIHEADLSHLQRAVEVYDDMCQLFPKDFTRIDCVRGEQLLDIPAVHELVWQKVQPLLPEPPKHLPHETAPSTTERFYTPQLPEAAQQAYSATLDQICDTCDSMARSLNSLLGQTATEDVPLKQQAAEAAIRAAMPVATQKSPLASTANQTLAQLASKHLPANHPDVAKPVQLTAAMPRNELDVAADIIYPYSALPARELRAAVDGWPYEQKAAALQAYLAGDDRSALQVAHYTWDVLCSYETYQQLKRAELFDSTARQPLTPRYGYDVPPIIEEAGLAETYSSCFDLSLRLYSQLQEGGHEHDAQLACLRGHRVRWQATASGDAAAKLRAALADVTETEARQLLQLMLESLAEAHPLLASAK